MAANPNSLVVNPVEVMPSLDETKPFVIADYTTICTLKTQDVAGRTRGAIAFGIARRNTPMGVATISTIEEAKAIVELLKNGIADAERIERGERPLAPEGRTPPRRDN